MRPLYDAETTLAPLLVLLAASVLVTQLRRLAVLARRPYLETRRTGAADLLLCACYAALAASHAGWLVYWAVAPGAPFELFFEACLTAVWAAAEVRRPRECLTASALLQAGALQEEVHMRVLVSCIGATTCA